MTRADSRTSVQPGALRELLAASAVAGSIPESVSDPTASPWHSVRLFARMTDLIPVPSCLLQAGSIPVAAASTDVIPHCWRGWQFETAIARVSFDRCPSTPSAK
jgi:hypothetical protein